MAETKKIDPTDLGLSSDDVRHHYEEFARLLLKRRDEILPRQDEARVNLSEQIAGAPGDDADISVLDTSADYFLKLANNVQQELIEIRDAIDRMDRGVYGICQNCNESISIERLRRLPYARFCIECQSAQEKGKLTVVPRPYPKL